jgi:hypothetical protein
MEKQLTPLQQFVEWCHQSSYSVHPKAIEKAIELQVIERKGFEDAYRIGCEEAQTLDYYPEKHAKEYFEETYKTEK